MKNARNTLRRRFQTRNKFSPNKFSKFSYSQKNRLNRRLLPKFRRNRLQRVQNVLGYYYRKFKRIRQQRNNYYSANTRQNTNVNSNKEIFVKGLPRFIDNKGLFNLFKNEGRIIKCNVLYDKIGFSTGIGKIEFADFSDVLKVIKNWNNTPYKGFTLKLEYKAKNAQNAKVDSTKLEYNRNYRNSSNIIGDKGYFGKNDRIYYNNYNYRYSRYKY